MADITNYVLNNTVYILDTLKTETTAKLIGDLTELVLKLPYSKPIDFSRVKMESPYDLRGHNATVIDVVLNSPGGSVYVLNTIANMLAVAKSKNVIIRTTATGLAASAASMLAVMGTPGFRIMYENATNMIHWGKFSVTAEKESEPEKLAAYAKKSRADLLATYLNYTKISEKKLKSLIADEGSYIMANECLKLGICDWILKSNGEFVRGER